MGFCCISSLSLPFYLLCDNVEIFSGNALSYTTCASWINFILDKTFCDLSEL